MYIQFSVLSAWLRLRAAAAAVAKQDVRPQVFFFFFIGSISMQPSNLPSIQDTNIRLDQIVTSLSFVTGRLLSTQPSIISASTSYSPSPFQTPHLLPAPFTPSPCHHAEAASPPLLPPVKKPTRAIILGSGSCIKFSVDDVGRPPAISFSDDLPGLNQM
jgi:hypothetical protein